MRFSCRKRERRRFRFNERYFTFGRIQLILQLLRLGKIGVFTCRAAGSPQEVVGLFLQIGLHLPLRKLRLSEQFIGLPLDGGGLFELVIKLLRQFTLL